MEIIFDGMVPAEWSESDVQDLILKRPGCNPPSISVKPISQVYDARVSQEMVKDEAEMFEECGFALTRHETNCMPWQAEQHSEVYRNACNEYINELEAIVSQRLLPGAKLELFRADPMLRRGLGSQFDYTRGVHQDVGASIPDYVQNLKTIYSKEIADAWQARYAKADVLNYIVINFWRTTEMVGPLRHMPLAICDPKSIIRDDILSVSLPGATVGGERVDQTALRYNPDQRWYYYPGITSDEVIAFKLFEARKSDEDAQIRSCFHAAFNDPTAASDVEPRRSCEQRIGFFCISD